MKKLIATAVAAVAVAAPLAVVAATPAEAAVRPAYKTVSRAEYRAVHVGMTQTQVHRIFGDNGRSYRGTVTWSYSAIDRGYCADGDTWACAEQDREYKNTSRWGSVDVDYYRDSSGVWRVSHKSAFWI